MKRITWATYTLSICQPILGIFLDNSANDAIYIGFYSFLNLFLAISTLLYIPIVISLKKYAYLASAQLNQPQRYVLWQLIAIVLGKMVQIPLLIESKNDMDYSEMIQICRTGDFLILPFVLQTTYIGCNRRNLTTLVKVLTTWKGWKMVFCPWRKTATIDVASTEETAF
uniref:Serpentine receptor class gamma n=1 Tax=Caenorhabditis tropicalis TaxID=1561998 RepID=A0A1I7THB1_9PELO